MINLDAFIKYLAATKNLSKNTQRAYEHDLKEMLCIIAKPINDMQLIDIYNYLDILQDKKNLASTRARKISALKTFFKYAKALGEIKTDISVNLDAPKLAYKIPVILSVQEVDCIIKTIADDNNDTAKSIRNNAIVHLFLNAGLRKNELLNLKLADIDFNTGCLLINGKGAKQRHVFINEGTLNLINKYIAEERVNSGCAPLSPYLFISRQKSQISKARINQIIGDIYKQCGITGKNVHTLRKTCATMMHNDGEDLATIQVILGHSSPVTTMRYTLIGEDMKRMAGQKKLF